MSRVLATATSHGPLLDTQQLTVSHEGTEEFHRGLEQSLHEGDLLGFHAVVDEVDELEDAYGRDVTLGADIHQEVHQSVVHFHLLNLVEEVLPSFLVRPVLREELSRNTLEEHYSMVVVALILAAKVDAIDQAHIAFLWRLNIYEILQNGQGVSLRELLDDESSLLLVLKEHLV